MPNKVDVGISSLKLYHNEKIIVSFPQNYKLSDCSAEVLFNENKNPQ